MRDMNEYKKHKQSRKIAKTILGKYKNLEVTWKKFDCGLSEDGLQYACEECVVCKYNNFLDYANTVGKPEGSTIEYNKFIDRYIEIVYE